ncbi:hypothetical protein M9H77_02607 [Catharanthus roseus]|uniref:Uncharacterized protein n=1 Tax=Catharanthus roseus TaxID=4058 RepID=A0ACC0C8U8_CATRO|nr:hypothetical protein M9H77_02607 [Catharanthus roseus]
MLNYKERPSKSSHSRLDENSIGITCQIFGLEMDAHNFGPLHMIGFTGVCNSSSSVSLLSSSETICVIAITCSVMFIVFLSCVIETVCLRI